jgi:hypothetical protein
VEDEGASGLKAGVMFFGFTARTSATLLLARRSAGRIAFYEGKPAPARDLLAAFRAGALRLEQ